MRHWIDIVENMASSRAYLYHGTDLNCAIHIIEAGKLESSSQYAHNPSGVSLTRDYRVSLEFGREWDRQFPVVFVFDQEKLRNSNIQFIPRQDSYVESPNIEDHETSAPPLNTLRYRGREAEEMVLGDLPLEPFLVSINISKDQLYRALGNAGKQYLEHLSEEGWQDLTEGWWKEHVNALLNHPKLNFWLPRIDGKHRAKQDTDQGYWQLSN